MAIVSFLGLIITLIGIGLVVSGLYLWEPLVRKQTKEYRPVNIIKFTNGVFLFFLVSLGITVEQEGIMTFRVNFIDTSYFKYVILPEIILALLWGLSPFLLKKIYDKGEHSLSNLEDYFSELVERDHSERFILAAGLNGFLLAFVAVIVALIYQSIIFLMNL